MLAEELRSTTTTTVHSSMSKAKRGGRGHRRRRSNGSQGSNSGGRTRASDLDTSSTSDDDEDDENIDRWSSSVPAQPNSIGAGGMGRGGGGAVAGAQSRTRDFAATAPLHPLSHDDEDDDDEDDPFSMFVRGPSRTHPAPIAGAMRGMYVPAPPRSNQQPLDLYGDTALGSGAVTVQLTPPPPLPQHYLPTTTNNLAPQRAQSTVAPSPSSSYNRTHSLASESMVDLDAVLIQHMSQAASAKAMGANINNINSNNMHLTSSALSHHQQQQQLLFVGGTEGGRPPHQQQQQLLHHHHQGSLVVHPSESGGGGSYPQESETVELPPRTTNLLGTPGSSNSVAVRVSPHRNESQVGLAPMNAQQQQQQPFGVAGGYGEGAAAASPGNRGHSRNHSQQQAAASTTSPVTPTNGGAGVLAGGMMHHAASDGLNSPLLNPSNNADQGSAGIGALGNSALLCGVSRDGNGDLSMTTAPEGILQYECPKQEDDVQYFQIDWERGKCLWAADAASTIVVTVLFLVCSGLFLFCWLYAASVSDFSLEEQTDTKNGHIHVSFYWVVPTVGHGVLLIAVLWFLWRTTLSNPGILKKRLNLPSVRPPEGRARVLEVQGVKVYLAYCPTCNIIRPPRASHCRSCNNCVDRFDHHCGVIGACIGRRNFRKFVSFLCSTVLHTSWSLGWAILLSIDTYDEERYAIFGILVVLCLVSFFVTLQVGAMLVFYIRLILRNQTNREYVKGASLYHLSEAQRAIVATDGEFAVFPFDRQSCTLNLRDSLCPR